MKKALIVSLLSLTVLFAGLTGLASAIDQSVNVTANVSNVFEVTLAGNAVSFTPSVEELEDGTPVTGAVTPVVSVKSNRLFSVDQTAADFVGGATAAVIPVSKMTYSTVSSDGTKTGNFAVGNTQLWASHSRGVKDFTSTYTLALDLNVEPDTYATVVTYSVLQNP